MPSHAKGKKGEGEEMTTALIAVLATVICILMILESEVKK